MPWSPGYGESPEVVENARSRARLAARGVLVHPPGVALCAVVRRLEPPALMDLRAVEERVGLLGRAQFVHGQEVAGQRPGLRAGRAAHEQTQEFAVVQHDPVDARGSGWGHGASVSVHVNSPRAYDVTMADMASAITAKA